MLFGKSPAGSVAPVVFKILLTVSLCCVALFAAVQGDPAPEQPIVVGYFPQLGIRKRFFVKNLVSQGAMGMLDQINYSQGHVDADHECTIADANADLNYSFSASDSVDGSADTPEMALRGNFHQLQELKRLYPDIKIVISLEGGAKSFAEAADPENRFAFVASCIQTFIEGNFGDGIHAPGLFDGIDLDWEYPAEEDKYNFLALLSEFRRQLDAAGPDHLLTVAMGDYGASYQHLDMTIVSFYVDQVGIMNYDYGGPWSRRTGLVAPLYSSPGDISKGGDVAATIQGYKDAGVPASKMLLGLPFYAYAWNNVSPVNHGLFQMGEPQRDDFPYSHIVSILGKFTTYRDPNSMAPWLFDGSTFWTYDDETSIGAKLEYARQEALGGVMIWDLSGDTADGKLLKTISKQFRNYNDGDDNDDSAGSETP
jgi:chitinase